MGILACPTCDGRYDVTGHPVGQRFRCRCGTVLTLEAERGAAQLACPHCGAGTSPTGNVCAHCSAELLVKSCPRCLSRVFHGHKHCPECGAELAIAASAAAHPDMPCPRCATNLRGRMVGDLLVDECPGCQGVFLDHVAIKRVVTDHQHVRADALLGALPRQEVRELGTSAKMYLKCPSCRVVMNRKQFATGAGVIVDVCRTHGTYFDVGELPRCIEFVINGGLARATEADLRRQKDELQHERMRLQQPAAMGMAFPVVERQRASTAGAALVDLLGALFG